MDRSAASCLHIRRYLVAALFGLSGFASGQTAASSLRFHGNGVDDIDRVKIRIDEPSNSLPGPPADVGASDFTIEFWLNGTIAENTAGPVTCGPNINWIFGNIVIDRDRYNQDRKFGISLAGGRLVWGVSGNGTGDLTICSTTSLLDGQWHHVAVQRRRSDGWLWLFVDGVLESQADGPGGDISYPDAGVPGNFCNGPCVNSDPFLVIGAEKHDADVTTYPSFSGWFDELRLSTTLRYNASFVRPAQPFSTDASTAALYHLDEAIGDQIGDSSGAAGGPSPGMRRFGGTPAGPEWSSQTPFAAGSTAPGRVPDARFVAGPPLLVRKNNATPTNLDLSWGASCSGGATDYSIHEGSLGVWYTHTALRCSTSGATLATITPSAANRYYLVVPLNTQREGSYGTDSRRVERPPSTTRCRTQSDLTSCP